MNAEIIGILSRLKKAPAPMRESVINELITALNNESPASSKSQSSFKEFLSSLPESDRAKLTCAIVDMAERQLDGRKLELGVNAAIKTAVQARIDTLRDMLNNEAKGNSVAIGKICRTLKVLREAA